MPLTNLVGTCFTSFATNVSPECRSLGTTNQQKILLAWLAALFCTPREWAILRTVARASVIAIVIVEYADSNYFPLDILVVPIDVL